MVHKSSNDLYITIFSDELYANLVGPSGLEVLQDGIIDPERTLNGLILLQHYQSLRSHLDTLRRQSLHNPTRSPLSEMELLVDGLLADGEVFKSFGYENLSEQNFLDFRLWEKFQQDSFERDVSALEEGFHEIDEDLEESPAPLHHPSSDGQQSLHAGPLFDAEDDGTNLPASQLCPNPANVYLADVSSTTDKVDDFEDLLTLATQEHGLFETGDAEQLFEAAKIGDELQVRLLLDRGACVHGNGFSKIPLSAAAIGGHEAVVELLLGRGAYIDGNGDSEISLFDAAEKGHRALEQLLLDRRAGVHDWTSKMSLFTAVKDGRAATVKLFLVLGVCVYGNGGSCQTPLFAAAQKGHKAIVQLLLDQGACVDGNGGSFQTPLFAAAQEGHEAIVQLLLDRGARTDRIPLVAAAREGHEAVVKLLLRQSLTTDDLLLFMRFLGDDESGQIMVGNVMVAAAILGRTPVMLQVFQKGVDINTVTQFGTALSIAAKNGNNHIVRWLLRRGADVNLAALILQTSGGMEHRVTKLFKIASSEYSDEEKFSPHARERAQTLRCLRKKFINQHILMKNAAEGSFTKFRELSLQYRNYRETWEASIKTVRKLNRGKRPTIADIIAYLCLAKAIQETLHDTGADDYTEPFFQDLVRWQLLFEQESDRDAYRDVIYSMWGVVLDDIVSSEGQVDAEVTIRFQALASTLISHASKQFGRIGFNERGFERSQQAWHLRNSRISIDADLTQDISILSVPNGIDEQRPEVLNTQPPYPDIVSTQSSLEQKIGHDISPLPDHAVVFLMLGALFAIVLIFFQRALLQRSKLT
jgi:ankyrin repeat protein